MLPIRGSAASLVAGSPGEAEYDLTTPSGTIFGTLTLPPIAGPMPVVLIIAGSGPTDRDGNGAILKLDMYKKLASALAGAGVATVRYDKRGVAASHAALASESDIRFGMLVDDAVGWIGKMRDDPRFSRIVIAGHSEGSLIGMIAAQRSAPAAFVSLEGIGFPAADVLRTQLTPRLAAYPELSKQTASIIGDLAAGKAVPQSDVPPALEALFRPSVQPYLISLFKYDPRVEIAKLTVPMTIVQGTHDVQVPVDNGRALAAAAPAASLVVIDSMTHVLTDDSATTLADQLQGAYADGARPLDQTLVKTLVATAKPV
jgi:pimeloyl-ACP methyl ester carboxylesterase